MPALIERPAEGWTMQSYYDAVVRYISTQERQASNGGTCVYRTSDGRQCAVGACVPDELYDARMDRIGSVKPLSENPTFGPLLRGIAWPDLPWGVELATGLQRLHDSSLYRNTLLDGDGNVAFDDDGRATYFGLSENGRARARDIAREFRLAPFVFDDDERS